jgi:hypothetical protein
VYSKRLGACLLGGAISAGICLLGGQIVNGFHAITWEDAAAEVANRLLLGLVLALSGWRIPHLLHGAVLGLIVSLTVSIGFLPDDVLGFALYTAAGTVYGTGIEWLATGLLQAPMKAS